MTSASGLEDTLRGMRAHAIAWGDVNDDGWLDLVVGTFGDRAPEDYRRRGATGPAPDRLLLGGPDGFEVDERFPELRGRTSGAVMADLTGDGRLDLVLTRNARRSDDPVASAPSVVLPNEGGRFGEPIELLAAVGARGVGVFDADGDDRLDLFVTVDRYRGGGSVLLRNEGELRFSDITAAAGLPTDIFGLAVATADLTGNGRADLFVADSNRLFTQTSTGRFVEADSSVFNIDRRGDEDLITGVSTGDLDRDGRTDLVLAPHFNSIADGGPWEPVRLYLNRGGEGTALAFEEVTDASGLLPLATKAAHVEVVDVDADAWPDLLVGASAASGVAPTVFRNGGLRDGVPQFEPVAPLGGEQYWVTGATADVDRDGRLEVVMAEFEPDVPTRMWQTLPRSGHWLEVSLPGPGTGVGAVIEVYPAGGLDEHNRMIARQELVAVQGYGAGVPQRVRVGLGQVEDVDLRVHVAGGRTSYELRSIGVDRHVAIHGRCPA